MKGIIIHLIKLKIKGIESIGLNEKFGLRFRIPHTITNSSHKGGDAVTDVS